jgi:hypothetical protein
MDQRQTTGDDTSDAAAPQYEPPRAEDVETAEQPSTTAAGATNGPT